jgi:hypothetical protein
MVGQDDEDHDAGGGGSFEHCRGEDADNGRYKGLGRAGGGGTSGKVRGSPEVAPGSHEGRAPVARDEWDEPEALPTEVQEAA